MKRFLLAALIVAGVAHGQWTHDAKGKRVWASYSDQEWYSCGPGTGPECRTNVKPLVDPAYQKDPVDVSPIEIPLGPCEGPNAIMCAQIYPTTIHPTRFSCADKTRFLMTAEDGSKHCIKLN
jgi:hypothetical protein